MSKTPKIKFTIITLFEDALKPYLNSSMMWKAQEKGIVEFDFVNLRDFGLGPHKSVDDTPYGGGDGMLLRCEPVFAAVEAVKEKDPSASVLLPTPAGSLWTQDLARYFADVACEGVAEVGVGSRYLSERTSQRGSSEVSEPRDGGRERTVRKGTAPDANPKHYIILCPHYEGYDERILSLVDHKISLGPYVLTGGELPALIIIDSITRLLPGVLGGEKSAEIESFSDGDNIEYPQYTKPADFRGMKVPDVLLSGHHANIESWRKAHTKKASPKPSEGPKPQKTPEKL